MDALHTELSGYRLLVVDDSTAISSFSSIPARQLRPRLLETKRLPETRKAQHYRSVGYQVSQRITV